MLEDSPRHETMLERNGSFHVRSAVINAAGHREQPVVDGSCPRVVFGFAGRNELDERLRRKTAIPHQSPVDVEHGVQQIFVMAGKNLQIGTLTADDRNLGVPPAHVAHTVLHGEDTRLRCDLELGFEVVRCLGRVRILEEDQRHAAFFVDCTVAILRRSLLIAEAQPAVGRIQEAGGRPRLDCPLCLQRGYFGAFQGDPGDDRDLSVNRLDEAFDDRGLLVSSEKRPFPGVTENDQAFDAFEAAEPGAESMDCRVVDLTVSGEWGNRCGDETSEIKGFHVIFLRCEKGSMGVGRIGSDAGAFPSLGANRPC